MWLANVGAGSSPRQYKYLEPRREWESRASLEVSYVLVNDVDVDVDVEYGLQ
jgi:hypothetical protein